MNRKSIEIAAVDHWRLERDEDDIAWLWLDRHDQSVNSLSANVLEQLGAALDAIEAMSPRGLIIGSAKASGFIVGADVREFEQLTDPEETTGRITQVHDLFYRIEAFGFPTVARIHGFCLGGGLELALACRYRIALDDAKTRLGFPEVLLGLHPGFGGTVRSINTIGVMKAMDLMLTGRSLDARRAARLGLIDRAVPERYLDSAARAFILSSKKTKKLSIVSRLTNTRFARPLVAKIMAREVAKKAQEKHYPAPYAAIQLWRDFGGDEKVMMREEAKSIAQLFVSPTSRNLQRVFFLQERLKGQANSSAFKATHVHVIGAGIMGGDIAAWCALRGCHVTLQDRESKYIAPAIERANKLFSRRLRDRYRRMAVQDYLLPDPRGDGIAHADVVIEAIIEDLDAKRALFESIEKTIKPGALLTTNTSSIPLQHITEGLDDPARLVGLHFFNPVAQMQLIEIIQTDVTRHDELDKAAAFANQIDRLPLPAQSMPGFLVNRVLSPYLQEAMKLLEEGVPVTAIDQAMTGFGMPMGPLELADTVGLDICLSVGKVLAEAFGGEVPSILQQKVAGGQLGRKNKKGFYRYKGSKLIRPKAGSESSMPSADIQDRMLLRLMNEAVKCLREGVVADADLVDVGMVFGTGFAPFRGGPLNYARERGIDEIRARFEQLSESYGERFEADSGWAAIAS